jgi:murein DD-endopeptidase MepM/ murein hydrolase activator NlpD
VQLAKATQQLKETKKQVQTRIRRIYIQGDESKLSALSGTKTAGEVASQGFLMDAIKHKDREVFNRFVTLQAQVKQKKHEQDQVVERVAKLENSQVTQTHALVADRSKKANLLDDLRQRTEELEQMIHQFEADESQITSEIQAFERAYAAAQRHRGHGKSAALGKFSGRFSRPVNAPITSTFGMRYHPILHRVRMHTGIDFGASFGTAIHAAAAGQVIFTNFMRGYGHVVIIDHGGGFSTVYAHTSRVFVSVGQPVKRGQEIAAVGATGLATGPHLHFEVRVNGHPVNPLGRL